jgi:endonuclease III
MSLHITADAAADELLTRDPLALLIGMLLDQQVAMETAFSGPLKIEERVGQVDAATLAAYDPDALVEAFRQPPAVHRYPGSMAARVQALCAAVQDDWGGDASAIWTLPAPTPNGVGAPSGASGRVGPDAPSGAEVLRRLKKLPGFGEQKAKIFLALLGKQCGFEGEGWREASAPYGEEGSFRSVADIVSPESLAKVREHKRAMKAAAKA